MHHGNSNRSRVGDDEAAGFPIALGLKHWRDVSAFSWIWWINTKGGDFGSAGNGSSDTVPTAIGDATVGIAVSSRIAHRESNFDLVNRRTGQDTNFVV